MKTDHDAGMPHLTEAQREALRNRSLSAADLLAVSEHLRTCAECRQKSRPTGPEQVLPRIGSPHLTYEDIEAAIDGAADAATRDRVAEHVALCGSCRADYEDLHAFRQSLQGRQVIPFPARKESRRTPVIAIAAAAMIAAVALSWWGLRREGNRQLPAPPASASSAAPASEAFDLLARVDPPPYRASTLRATPSDPERAFRDAMKLYAQGDYRAALPALQSAAALDAAAGPHFYLGICQLVAGDASGAAAEFERVIALGDSPYLEKAQFFLAKARLRQKDGNGAAKALEAAIALHGDYEDQARALLRRLGQAKP
jgi:TolA-binding protein